MEPLRWTFNYRLPSILPERQCRAPGRSQAPIWFQMQVFGADWSTIGRSTITPGAGCHRLDQSPLGEYFYGIAGRKARDRLRSAQRTLTGVGVRSEPGARRRASGALAPGRARGKRRTK